MIYQQSALGKKVNELGGVYQLHETWDVRVERG